MGLTTDGMSPADLAAVTGNNNGAFGEGNGAWWIIILFLFIFCGWGNGNGWNNGVGAQVREITERAMRGEIDFRESFKERVALLKGLDVSVMQEIAENLPITEGVERLMRVLKRAGYKIAILSGGFTYFGNYLKHKFGIDYVYANELEIVDGKLTGNYLGEIVDGQRKAELLKLLAQVENVDIAQTIAVGDGANDLPMITVAGLGIAFHAKPKVKQTARQSISTIGLDGVLYFLGFKDSFINEP